MDENDNDAPLLMLLKKNMEFMKFICIRLTHLLLFLFVKIDASMF